MLSKKAVVVQKGIHGEGQIAKCSQLRPAIKRPCAFCDPRRQADGPSKLAQLQELCTHEDLQVCKLAMLSLLAVFKDVLPGYRIRLPTAKEKQVQVTKSVRLLRTFERRLLTG